MLTRGFIAFRDTVQNSTSRHTHRWFQDHSKFVYNPAHARDTLEKHSGSCMNVLKGLGRTFKDDYLFNFSNDNFPP